MVSIAWLSASSGTDKENLYVSHSSDKTITEMFFIFCFPKIFLLEEFSLLFCCVFCVCSEASAMELYDVS